MRYEEWMRHVNRIVQRETGMSVDDLPDWLSRDAFDIGLTPKEGAMECISNAGEMGWLQETLVDEV